MRAGRRFVFYSVTIAIARHAACAIETAFTELLDAPEDYGHDG
jgi:hypothetical protein